MTMDGEEAMATLLPWIWAQELRNASRVHDPFERIKEIDRVSDRLRAEFPQFFRRDGDDQGDRTQ